MIPRRFDPYFIHPMGSKMSAGMEECLDGAYVLYSDFEEILKLNDSCITELKRLRKLYGIKPRTGTRSN